MSHCLDSFHLTYGCNMWTPRLASTSGDSFMVLPCGLLNKTTHPVPRTSHGRNDIAKKASEVGDQAERTIEWEAAKMKGRIAICSISIRHTMRG